MKRLILLLALLAGCVAHGPDAEELAAAKLIADGRSELIDRHPDAALALFEEAAELDDGAFASHVWILRAWMDQGRNNDVLDAIDNLQSDGRSGPVMDYLYGMAFVRRAEAQIAQGVTDSSIEMNLLDASERLRRATDADPEQFSDAFHSLAKASWYTKNLELARASAESAVAFHGSLGQSWLLLGRVAMSQFRVEHDAQEWSPAGEAHWMAAVAAFERAIVLLGHPREDEDRQRLLADAALQLGHARMWKKHRVQAATAYATAMAWSPSAVDYALLRDLLVAADPGPGEAADQLFNAALEDATSRFEEIFGVEDARDATMLWWLGWTRAELGRPVEASDAFARVLHKAPELASTWYNLAMAHHAAGDFGAALAALRCGWDTEPALLVAEMQADLSRNIWKLEKITEGYRDREDFAACAFLAELCAESQPDEARHWNNLGLFARFQARAMLDSANPAPEAQGTATDPDADAKALAELYERSFAAYERALALSPDDASVLNDAAVILHYFLKRELERAGEMYDRAATLAAAALADDDVIGKDRAFMEQVARDIRANQSDLHALSTPVETPQ